MFYTFNQNNSGGTFDFDEKRGITHIVIVEALDENEAIKKAEEIGLYFDGVNDGRDCECCGDRWYTPYKGSEIPEIYNEPVEQFKPIMVWMPHGKEVCVHYMNGDIKWYTYRSGEKGCLAITEVKAKKNVYEKAEKKIAKAKAKAKKTGKPVIVFKQKKAKKAASKKKK